MRQTAVVINSSKNQKEPLIKGLKKKMRFIILNTFDLAKTKYI
ncbi:Putative protein [Zobellia galactanivorans]|uniref:Uncharacterized protein n=1 Tax=Zobellia galactanivorans (strain DSM 12802 / CCUG 47099 / CIP 106680 / NCIMB 13871 / Dsij) TaxID=63186 RepID=G0L8G3_ZOBGA|nr:Putative protein [Zobellia galactanivorans]